MLGGASGPVLTPRDKTWRSRHQFRFMFFHLVRYLILPYFVYYTLGAVLRKDISRREIVLVIDLSSCPGQNLNMEAASARYAARDRFGGFGEPAQTPLQRYIRM